MCVDYILSRVRAEIPGDEERIYKEQDIQCTYKVSLRCVRATFVAVEN
jgi:hypothetical protein